MALAGDRDVGDAGDQTSRAASIAASICEAALFVSGPRIMTPRPPPAEESLDYGAQGPPIDNNVLHLTAGSTAPT